MLRWLLLSCLSIWMGTVHGQIKGKVYDSENQTPLGDVLIMHDDSLIGATGPNGVFDVLPLHQYDTITFRRLGYRSRQIAVAPDDSFLVVTMKTRSFDVGDVVVRAYNSREKAFKAPGPLNILHTSEIKEISSSSTAPVMNSLPGLYMHSGAKNTNRITIRGIGSRSQYTTTKIKAYLNGIPLTTGVGETTLEDLDLNLVDRITVLKGPASSIHGAALGGTILYRMGIPSETGTYLTQEVVAGSYNMFQNSTHLNWKGEHTGIRIAYDKFSDRGFRQNDTYNRDALTALFRHQLTPAVGVTYLGRYHRLKAYIPSSLDESTYINHPARAAENWNSVNGHESYRRMLHGLSFDVDFNGQLRNETSLFLKTYNGDEVRPFNILDDKTLTTGMRTLFEWKTRVGSANLDAEAGYELFREAYDWKIYETLEEGDWGELLHRNEQKRMQHNLFSALTLKWDQLDMSVGVNLNRTGYRYNDLSVDGVDYSDQKFYQWIASPRFSMTYELTDQAVVFGLLSHGFSAPSYEETLNAQGFVNGSIKPETGWNREVGLRLRSQENQWFIKTSAYSILVRDLLVTKRIAEDEFRKINAGATLHQGLEIMGKIEWLNKAFARSDLNVSYMRTNYQFMDFVDEGQDYAGNDLPGIPENKLSLRMRMEFPGGIYLQGNWLLVDKMPMNDGNTLYSEAYNRLDVKAGIRLPLSSGWRFNLYGGIRNAADQHYSSMVLINAPSYGGSDPRYYYPAEPRNYFAGLSIQYAFNR
jgi:iron complex outermembrane receptor protein